METFPSTRRHINPYAGRTEDDFQNIKGYFWKYAIQKVLIENRKKKEKNYFDLEIKQINLEKKNSQAKAIYDNSVLYNNEIIQSGHPELNLNQKEEETSQDNSNAQTQKEMSLDHIIKMMGPSKE